MNAGNRAVDGDALVAAYRAYYADAPFVRLWPDLPELRFAANTPYDQIVRELLLAEGRVAESGPLLFYAALGSFACAVLIAVLGGVISASNFPEAFEIAALIGFFVGAVGVGALTAGCALMVAEVRLALKQTSDDTDAVLNRAS